MQKTTCKDPPAFSLTLQKDPLNCQEGDEENQNTTEKTEDTSDKYENKTNPASSIATPEKAVHMSLWAVRLGVLVDSINNCVLDPNYPFMVLPDSHPDSFPSTEPLGPTAATYFLRCVMLGSAIGSYISGYMSDKVGRKPTFVFCLAMGAIISIPRYMARHSFWMFSAAHFCHGLFTAVTPIAVAYASDVKPTRREKDQEISIMTAILIFGVAGGGLSTIIFEKQGLFAPIFLGMALNVVATLLAVLFIIEPKKMKCCKAHQNTDQTDKDEEEEESSPKYLNRRVFSNILMGAIFDIIGSTGLWPLAMAPLALQKFYTDFLLAGEDPLMTQTAFKWLTCMLAFTVIPSAAISQPIYNRIGAPAGCILGNVITGFVIFALLSIATINPATTGTYIAFICTLYLGTPFTIISQLSTAPMLDSIAPANKRGSIQGVNTFVMNFMSAITPYVMGEISDNFGVSTIMWTCVSISFAAGLVNLPLVFVRELKPKFSRDKKVDNTGYTETNLEQTEELFNDLDPLDCSMVDA